MKLLLFLSLLLVFASCKTINVVAPIHSTIVAPPIKQSASSLNIPVEIEMKNYLKMAEDELPKMFEGSAQQCEGVSYSYVFLRDPINFHFNNSIIDYDVGGKFELKLNYCPECVSLWGDRCISPRIYASCGSTNEPMRRVRVYYSTVISLGSDYKFRAATSLKQFDVLDPCLITVFNYDATQQVKKEVSGELVSLEKDIDKQIEDLDIKSSINEAWKALLEPFPIANYGFLYIQPKSMGMGELLFKNTKAYVDLHLSILPFVSTEIKHQKEIEMPPLETYKGESGFNLMLDIRASYDSLSSFLNTQFNGKELSFKRKKITVTKLSISGAQDQKLVFKMDFDGVKKGTVYLSGTPVLDVSKQKISLSELDFDVKTKSVLIKVAKWLLNKKIMSEFTEKTVFDLRPFINEARKNIVEAINTEITEGVKMSGEVNKLILHEIYLDQGHLLLRSKLTGLVKIKM